ncbi:MAG: type II toxin-antitoxin system HicA family toxin [Mollicutes bacterium]|nr:type II toxin-antitoxin system HicA family toxin [Mollicutes bacterium]
MCIANGFEYSRCNGSHFIFINSNGRHISVPRKLEAPIARRLIKENNLTW